MSEDEDVQAAKSALRKRIIAARDSLAESDRHDVSSRINAHLLGLESLRNAPCVMAYASFGGEFDTTTLLERVIDSGAQLVLPLVDKATKSLRLFYVRDLTRDLMPGIWGIREPDPKRCAPAPDDAVQFVLTPGVAFTTRGARLGYGGGFYDKLVARFASRPTLVAAAFSLQVVDELPLTDNDQRVDTLVTELGVLHCA